MKAQQFIKNWSGARVGERASFQPFISELCDVLNVEVPDRDRPGHPDYGFERPVRLSESRKSGALKPSRMDLYRRGCFVMEAKQPERLDRPRADPRRHEAGWAAANRSMRQAKREAEEYARGLDTRPPFLITVAMGEALELWADFAAEGGAYTPFLVGGQHRIELARLVDPEVRATLARVWNDPWGLNPDREAVTADIAGRLGRLIQSIAGYPSPRPDARADPVLKTAALNKACIFVSQCMFAMFLDSSGHWKGPKFRELMEDYRDQPNRFPLVAVEVFDCLQRGGHCSAIRHDVPRFQRDIFAERVKPTITAEHMDVLIEAAHCDWSSAGPDLFGVLLEMVKDPGHRCEFGVHFTDRRLVERVVQATVMEPLRAEWSGVEAQALRAAEAGDERRAGQLILAFQRRLCAVRVLDPACGTGNFLYVALALMTALETEVLLLRGELAPRMAGQPVKRVGLGQFIGLEKDGATARMARLVMTIGLVQAHRRSGQKMSADQTWGSVDLRVQDALLAQDALTAAAGFLSRQSIAAQRWPEVDFIVGNPPFLGGRRRRQYLGDAYVNALNDLREGRFRLADLATCWWDRAARILARDGSRLRRFGFVMPATVTQAASREVMAHHLNGQTPMRLAFAIPDHPWAPLAAAASVRVAVTVVERGRPNGEGRLLTLSAEGEARASGHLPLRETRGDLAPDLTIGLDIARVAVLKANEGLASRGVQVNGPGFVVDEQTAARPFARSAPDRPSPARPYRNGRDLAERPRGVRVIDFYGWSEDRVRRDHPGFHEHLLETVKAGRERNSRARYSRDWWLFSENRSGLRTALQGLDRYIVTLEIGKHRWFTLLGAEVVADNRLVCVASDDPFILGVLSSRAHRIWAEAVGGSLEDRPIYTKTACFDRFAFPDARPEQRVAIGAVAKSLDRVRAEVLAGRPRLTMTGLYNALAAGEDAGGIARVRRLHAELDDLVAAAYGWSGEMAKREVIARLIDLNRQRAEAEAQGRIAWLRPDLQARAAGAPVRPSPRLAASRAGAGVAVLRPMPATAQRPRPARAGPPGGWGESLAAP